MYVYRPIYGYGIEYHKSMRSGATSEARASKALLRDEHFNGDVVFLPHQITAT